MELSALIYIWNKWGVITCDMTTLGVGGCGVLVFPKITALITAVHVRRAIISLPFLHILLSPPALFVTRDTLWVAICNLPPPACPQPVSSSTCSNRDRAYTECTKKLYTLNEKVNSRERYKTHAVWRSELFHWPWHIQAKQKFPFQMLVPKPVSWL
jgi:hypothetical protein